MNNISLDNIQNLQNNHVHKVLKIKFCNNALRKFGVENIHVTEIQL